MVPCRAGVDHGYKEGEFKKIYNIYNIVDIIELLPIMRTNPYNIPLVTH